MPDLSWVGEFIRPPWSECHPCMFRQRQCPLPLLLQALNIRRERPLRRGGSCRGRGGVVCCGHGGVKPVWPPIPAFCPQGMGGGGRQGSRRRPRGRGEERGRSRMSDARSPEPAGCRRQSGSAYAVCWSLRPAAGRNPRSPHGGGGACQGSPAHKPWARPPEGAAGKPAVLTATGSGAREAR